MKKKKNLFLSFALGIVLLFGVVQTMDAKFWGSETDPAGTTDWSDGNCTYRITCSTYYVFWIEVSHTCSDPVRIACLYN